MLRIAGMTAIGYPHHITQCTNYRQKNRELLFPISYFREVIK